MRSVKVKRRPKLVPLQRDKNVDKVRRSFTKVERLAVRRKTGGRCAYCGEELPEKGWHVDHIHPHRRGGTNVFKNLNPACSPCNLFKHTWGLEGFREQLQLQVERARKYSVNFRMAERYGKITVNPVQAVTFYFERMDAERAAANERMYGKA